MMAQRHKFKKGDRVQHAAPIAGPHGTVVGRSVMPGYWFVEYDGQETLVAIQEEILEPEPPPKELEELERMGRL